MCEDGSTGARAAGQHSSRPLGRKEESLDVGHLLPAGPLKTTRKCPVVGKPSPLRLRNGPPIFPEAQHL